MDKNTKSEKTLINIIKFGAVVPIIVISIIFTYIFVQYKNEELKNEIENLRVKFLNENKKNVKDEVNRVVSSIKYEIERSDEELKNFLKNKVYEAHSIATNIYNESIKNGEKDKNKIFETIKQTLGSILYNKGRGYIFIDDINGIKLLQPTNKSFEGKDFSNFEDPKGYKFVQKIMETIRKKGEAYDEYFWYKTQTDKEAYKKISFYKYFEPYNVAIGTGEYFVDFEKKIQNRLLERIRRIKFDDNGYIVIFNSKGTYLSHFKKDNIGKNGFKIKDKEGNYFIKDIVNFAKKNKEGYLSYIASARPDKNEQNREKVTYLKYFKQWDWIIGAGFYLEELNKEVKEKELLLTQKHEEIIQKIIVISFTVTFILILLSSYISKILFDKFNEYKKEIKKEVDKTIEKEKLLVQQSKMAIMGEMIANIAHQWKQPLNLISTSNSLIKLNKEFDNFSTPEEIDEAIENIDHSVKHLATTIDDFRNFFKPNKIKSVFKIDDLLNKAFKLLDTQLKNSNIEVISDVKEIEVYGFENELLQVLINIIKNAIDELFKIHDKKFIFINAYRKDSIVVIRVKDTAGGIPKKMLDKVFQAYFTTKGDKGTGIGLYMCKQIINNINGEIRVTNVDFTYKEEKYKGAEFIITIPFQTSI
ncbi:Cache sensor-containing signal transduction histidine kinase [Halarcobacter anaerophilus]|nr:Cache sensor-containing signal transduction histidine kinase [Halarcobacter anaerophilus]